jgi:hypothetical protein
MRRGATTRNHNAGVEQPPKRYYDDLGQTVPDPGLVRLGVVDSGLDYLADAGRRFTVRVDLAAATGL